MSALAVVYCSDPVTAMARLAVLQQVVEQYKQVKLLRPIGCGPVLGTRTVTPGQSVEGQVVCQDGKSWVLWIGQPFLPEQDKSLLEETIKRFPAQPDRVLQALEGHFFLAGFHAEDETLYMAGDAVGSLGVYYAVHSGDLLVSTSALAIVGQLPSIEPDCYAIQSFLFTGGYAGDHTLFAPVKRLEGGKLYTFKGGRLCTRSWHSFLAPQSDSTMAESIDIACERFAELLVRLLTRSLVDAAAVRCQLTAGYDTRVVAAALSHTGVPFTSTVYGPDGHPDVEAARELSTLLHWDLEITCVPENWGTRQWQFIQQSIGLTDGHYDLLGFARHRFWDTGQSRSTPWLCSGIGGELLRDFFWRQEFIMAGRSTSVNLPRLVDTRIINREATTLTTSHISLGAFRAQLIAQLQEQIDPYPQVLNTSKLDLLYVRKITRFGCEYMSGSMPYLHVIAPLLFRRVLEFSLSLPPEARRRTWFIRHVVPRLNQVIANARTGYGHPLTPVGIDNWYRFAPWVLDDTRRIVRKAAKMAGGLALFADNTNRGYEDGRPIADLLALEEVTDLLDPAQMYTRGFYAADRLRAFLDQARVGKVSSAGLFGRLLTLELIFHQAHIQFV